MKRRWFSVFILSLVALALVACGGQRSAVSEESAVAPAAGDFYSSDAGAGMAEVMPAEAPSAMADTANLAQIPQERLIIRTADMTIVVTDTEAAMEQIGQMVEGVDGWVVSSNVYQASETAKSGYLTVRVPAEGFQNFLDAIGALSVEVTSLSTSGQDVTEEYVDLSSQLANLEATAARVRNFLDEARTTEEALAVNAELSRLEGEIQVIKGRMQYLDQSSAFSSVTINLTPDELAQPIEIGGWEPQGVLKDAFEALIQAMQAIASLAIWFAVFLLPILLVVAIPLLILFYLVRRRRAAKRAVPPSDTPAA